jgi:AcrR family transcriptional regulator
VARTGGKARAGGSSSAATRAALIDGAISALREAGFAGASAREIARRAGCNQSLLFYHFGSVTALLLAALDEVSALRRARYDAIVQQAGSLAELTTAARQVFEEDLDRGYVTVLVQLIAGAQSTPGLAEQIAGRLLPWRDLAGEAVAGALPGPLARMVPAGEIAHATVALYLGLELLAELDGDRAAALALFDRADALAGLLSALGPRSRLRRADRPGRARSPGRAEPAGRSESRAEPPGAAGSPGRAEPAGRSDSRAEPPGRA